MRVSGVVAPSQSLKGATVTPSLKALYPEQSDVQAKVCTKCGLDKSLDDFCKNKNGRLGRTSACRDCTKKSRDAYREANRAIINKHALEYYYKNRPVVLEKVRKARVIDPDKIRIQCKTLRDNNPERYAEYQLTGRLRRFGVDIDWYARTINAQGGKCAICKTTKPRHAGEMFCIDHNHNCCGEKKACDKCRRGLLCFVCNTRLSFIESEWKRDAINYLNKYKHNDDKNTEQPLLFDGF
jgi:hypothetical protein